MSSTSSFDKAVNTFTSVTAMDPNGYGMTMLSWNTFALGANHLVSRHFWRITFGESLLANHWEYG
ncbi:MAG: hypothetical protein ACK5OC_07100 [Pirellula sp.]